MPETPESGFLFPEMEEKPEQKKTGPPKFFETPKAPPPSRFERGGANCQYCEGVGPCMYCKRGKKEAAKLRK